MNKSLGIYNIIDQEGIKKSMMNIINHHTDFNTYTTPKGLKELRIEISRFIKKNWNYNINDQNIMITTGSQQSINLIAQTILTDKDTVLIEQPTYFGAIEVFKKRNIKLIGIDLYEDGLDLEMLEQRIIKHSPKLIYVTPTFNNPTGYSWTNENRQKFLNIINKYNMIVLEDDPYSLINFTNNQYHSLYKMNNGKNIIYLGTFSKIISPSINVGYMITNEEIIYQLYSLKKSFDLCTNLFLQYVVLDYLKNNDIERIIKNKIVHYKILKRRSITRLNRDYKNEIEYFSNSKGGLFYLVKFKSKIDEKSFENGNNYYIYGNHDNITRINICS